MGAINCGSGEAGQGWAMGKKAGQLELNNNIIKSVKLGLSILKVPSQIETTSYIRNF